MKDLLAQSSAPGNSEGGNEDDSNSDNAGSSASDSDNDSANKIGFNNNENGPDLDEMEVESLLGTEFESDNKAYQISKEDYCYTPFSTPL
ncbi:hypothetical protein RSOLAG1IB_11641 [Rhizoctonia solani AG-1 IB]|uniref:Uncharacterized protein n=1 Tax=Thanatephorus cucumeris (strain AG1-IB / isolate 7/3/14) TaxID=1108050 RepID=M5C8S6_THACB|nr:hypothetical protein BN14_10542 [Rhizoctonia solani AG-1 IB]CEL54395.1 hypothetical protein RSOLAG1IB_11641 [Rhizoctonia solani AG-1 IB]